MRGFGDLEAVVMERLWARESATTVREVLDDLQPARPLAYTTILTVMDNLHRKGFLAREREGRAHRYWPTKSRTQYASELMDEALADSGDRAGTLLRFFERMPQAEVTRLRLLLTEDPDASESGDRP